MSKSQSFKHLNYSKRIICSSVDYNFSLAIPFYNKSIKTLVVPSVYKHAQTVHDMIPNWLYFLVTLPAYALVIFWAWVIPDVEIVINFVGSIGNSILNFIIPGIFYFIIMKNVEKKWKIYLALVFAIYGFVMGSFWTGVNVWTTIAPV